MTDKFSPSDEEIIQNLRSLKDSGQVYPEHSLQKRRALFQQTATTLVLTGPALGFPKDPFHYFSHLPARVVEMIMISVLVVEAGLGVYLFRDQIKGWLFPGSDTPTVLLSTRTVDGTGSPFVNSSTEGMPLSATSTASTRTPPIPTVTAKTITPAIANTSEVTPAPAHTIVPTSTGEKTLKKGYHYGQTKTPNP